MTGTLYVTPAGMDENVQSRQQRPPKLELVIVVNLQADCIGGRIGPAAVPENEIEQIAEDRDQQARARGGEEPVQQVDLLSPVDGFRHEIRNWCEHPEEYRGNTAQQYHGRRRPEPAIEVDDRISILCQLLTPKSASAVRGPRSRDPHQIFTTCI